MGSGGGFDGSGRGGGRIILSSTLGTVNISGAILAEGSASSIPGYGSGSGGSISIFATEINGNGTASVRGGDSVGDAGAGSGGRIFIAVSNASYKQRGCV